MPEITFTMRRAYRVPSTGRYFFTLQAACYKEAFHQARKKYGYEEEGGAYRIQCDERLMRAVWRLARRLERRAIIAGAGAKE